MRAVADLYAALDQTNRTARKVAILGEYFRSAADDEKICLVALFCGWHPPRAVGFKVLRQWAAGQAGVDQWLFDECYAHVGDLAETIALLLPPVRELTERPLRAWLDVLDHLRTCGVEEQRRAVVSAWNGLPPDQCFIFNKLITGGFRVGVSQALVVRALSDLSGLAPAVLVHRLMGKWSPLDRDFASLIAPQDDREMSARPYPFCLAEPLAESPTGLGNTSDWLFEWKWDGIRAQAVRQSGSLHIWSRGEELVTPQFPELGELEIVLPEGTVLDGEILAYRNQPLGFNALQRRLGRKRPTASILRDVPVLFMAYDLLEENGHDVRDLPLRQRRERLVALVGRLADGDCDRRLLLSPELNVCDWQQAAGKRGAARRNHVEGLMIKRIESPYVTGRQSGVWWKWKLDPLSVDAVLVYAYPGHGRRAGLFSDYTFAVRDGEDLVPFAKAYTGLTDEEITEVDSFVRRNTLGRRGPARIVQPQLVFEISFADVVASKRHRSGIGVRFPRILRWRHDKRATDADTLEHLKSLAAHHDGEAPPETPQLRQLSLFE